MKAFTSPTDWGSRWIRKTLYFADSAARLITLTTTTRAGMWRNRRVFVKVPSDEGLPDGLTVDAEGFVWSAQWYGSCVDSLRSGWQTGTPDP
jgi:sugar lactone lactonase YvrE